MMKAKAFSRNVDEKKTLFLLVKQNMSNTHILFMFYCPMHRASNSFP